MKFLAALVASAYGAAYTTCSTTLTHYGSADTTCASASDGSSTISAIVGQCTYMVTKTTWMKVTACTLTTMDVSYHNSAECSDTALAAQKTAFTAKATCIVGASIQPAATFYSKMSTDPVAVASAALCAFTMENYAAASCSGSATAHSPTLASYGIAGGPWIVNQCYYMAASKSFKITSCTDASNWIVIFYDAVAGDCSGSAHKTFTASGVAFVCTDAMWAANTSNWKILTVVHTHTVSALVAAPAAAAAAATGAKTLVSGALAAVSMMYL